MLILDDHFDRNSTRFPGKSVLKMSYRICVTRNSNRNDDCRIIRCLRNVPRRLPTVLSTVEKNEMIKHLEMSSKLQEQKIVSKKVEINRDLEDSRLKTFFTFKNQLAKSVKMPTKVMDYIFKGGTTTHEKYRCQDIITFQSDLTKIQEMMKDEHLAIALAFQSLNEATWKTLKIKSNQATDQICVTASLKVDDTLENPKLVKDKLIEKINPLCTSLHIVTSELSKIEGQTQR